MIHTLDNSNVQRNLLKAQALFQLASELILDNADYQDSTILSDLEAIGDFISERVDDRLLEMDNPYFMQLRNGKYLEQPNSVNAKVTVALGLIRGTEFQKEELG